jgi:hypothetical protein
VDIANTVTVPTDGIPKDVTIANGVRPDLDKAAVVAVQGGDLNRPTRWKAYGSHHYGPERASQAAVTTWGIFLLLKFWAVKYVKDIVSEVTAIFIAQLVCSWSFLVTGSRAIGLPAVAAASVENLLSPISGLSLDCCFGCSSRPVVAILS